MNNCLVMLTKTFPFDKGEEFIENEVPVLAKAFKKVILIATSTADQAVQTRNVPENTSVFRIPASRIKRGIPAEALKFLAFPNYNGCCGQNEKEAVGRSLKKRLYLAYFLAKSERVYREASKILAGCELEKYGGVTFYSYWFYDTAAAAVRLKNDCPVPAKRAISRAHGYDLYSERNSMNYLPLRNYLMENVDMVYPCSQNGSSYLKKRYPEYSFKVETAYLGTGDRGLSPESSGGEFHIVSCCYIVPVKRVELLAQALAVLKNSGLKLKWTHFGDGDGLEELKNYAADSLGFMECRLAGKVKNPELMEYYRNNPVDVFINTSSSEGLPVSIMEASSFGIPTIATNVGGTGEIVRDGETGFLLKADVSPEELADKIKQFALLPEDKKKLLRKNCRSLWMDEFNAATNYERFAKNIQPV